MRAKTVNENIDFERNQDPKKALGLGYGNIKIGIRFNSNNMKKIPQFCEEFNIPKSGSNYVEATIPVMEIQRMVNYLIKNCKFSIRTSEFKFWQKEKD